MEMAAMAATGYMGYILKRATMMWMKNLSAFNHATGERKKQEIIKEAIQE